MKKILSFILAFLILPVFVGCSDDAEPEQHSYDFISMDTVFSIQTGAITAESGKSSDDIFEGCEKITADIESAISRDLETSDLHNLNKYVNVLFDADPILIDVLGSAINIAKLTDNAYDPTVGNLTLLWNVKGGGPVPKQIDIENALRLSGTELIEIKDDAVYKNDPDVMLDLGGIGKGYAAQKLIEHLYSEGVSYGIVSAGRTVGVFGEKPDLSKFKIGIADPFHSDGVVGYIYTDSGFISVAGDYEQYFEEDGVRYHHIIDPATGYPSKSGLSSVAVFSQNGAIADALSTALLVMGYDKAMEFYRSGEMSFEAVFIESDGKVSLTDGLTADRFEMSEDYNPSDVTTTTAATTATATESETSAEASETAANS